MGQSLLLQQLHSGQDLCNAGLVIGTQQGGAVGGDEGLALHGPQERKHRGLHHHAGGRQSHIAAIVVLPHHGLHVLAAGIAGGVQMGDQSKGGLVLAARGGGQGTVDVAMLVHPGILDAKALHFLHKLTGKVKFPLGRGVGTGVLVRGGVDPDIIQKTFIGTHRTRSFFLQCILPNHSIIPSFSAIYNSFCGRTGREKGNRLRL